MSFASTEMNVIVWGTKLGIIKHSTPRAQAEKTREELEELFDAIEANDKEAMADAYGDLLVTMVMGATIADLDLVTCFEGAYQEIKDRRGSLNTDGLWVKEA